ncbi:MAG: tRNA-(ms[2]io[6]A)-hydroxylase [Oceanospirillaceae bacterium]|nr:tRNA-(ms[2]io[6]A)-hydroxylase [Oceanospirillaceae bacterium]
MSLPETSELSALSELKQFLGCSTPSVWVEKALEEQDILLIDHAHCEKKAASTAMQLMFRHPTRPDLLTKMSRLAKEELIHFEQVCRIMRQRGVAYDHLDAGRYVGGMRQLVRTHEPAKLMDTLIIGAFVEARSCERFELLIPHLDSALAKFYASLLKSEARHYQDYLSLAKNVALEEGGTGLEDYKHRIALVRDLEVTLICTEDALFRFHSGVPPITKSLPSKVAV